MTASVARQRILDTTTALPYRGGTNGVGVDLVVVRAGVANPTLCRDFRSEEELVMACLEADRMSLPVHGLAARAAMEGGPSPARTPRRVAAFLPRLRTAQPEGVAPAMAMSILVVDGEHGARGHLGARLRGLADVARVIESGNGAEAVEIIRTQRPDIVFLDVRLPGLGGFEVIQAVGEERMPLVVFVTACAEHATRAFEVGALDYLVKPYDEERWRVALDRARRRLETGAAAALHRQVHARPDHGATGKAIDRIAVKILGRMIILQVQDIDWLEARDNYVRLHVGNAFHLVRGKISSFETRLDPRRFVRVHRGALVNVDKIAEVRSGLRGNVVVLKTGVQVPVGSTRREEFRQRLVSLAGV